MALLWGFFWLNKARILPECCAALDLVEDADNMMHPGSDAIAKSLSRICLMDRQHP